MKEILSKLNNTLGKCLNDVIDDNKELRKQIYNKDKELVKILKQFKNIIKQDYINEYDKLDKINELSVFYINVYERKKEPERRAFLSGPR